MVPLVTPARRAMSSSLVAAKPRSEKTSRAAARISSGRASLRRCQRGRAAREERRLTAVAGIGGLQKLLTERSVSNFRFPPGSTPLPIKSDQIGVRSRNAQLAQKDDDLAAMVGGVIDEMPEHLPERMNVFATGGRLYDARLGEPNIVQIGYEGRPLPLDLLPPAPHVRQRAEVGSLRHRRIGLPQPPVQPQLLRPHDMGERAMNAAEAAFQIAEVLLLRQGSDRVEDDAVRPGVEREQLEQLVHNYRAAASSPASITESFTSRPSIACLSPITEP